MVGSIHSEAPHPAPIHDTPEPGRSNRARGVMLGLAVGDALGMPLEFLSKDEIRRHYGGVVRDYVRPIPRHPCAHLTPGQYTDDTQMALALARTILDKGEFSPHAFKRRLIEWYECKDHRAPGNACIEAVARLDQGVSYKESGQLGAAGCGSAMRVPPLALCYAGKALVQHSHLQSLMTHRDARASIGAVLTARIVSRLLIAHIDSFDRGAFLHEITGFVVALEDKLGHRKREFSSLLAKFPDLLELPFEEGIPLIGTSGYVVQTVLAAFYGFLHSPHDFEQTLVNVINEGDDADSVGAIAGAFSGAFNGMAAIPERWLGPLEGREELIGIADRLSQLGVS
jgi:ADP-ribosyl-[dinitrogen reductase] hydrolase